MGDTILVLLPVYSRQKSELARLVPGDTILYSTPEDVTVSQVLQADIIIGNPPISMVRRSDRLKLLQLESVGASSYLAKGVMPEGAVLLNAAGAYGQAISEHMLGMTLMLLKKLHLYRDNQRNGQWRDLGHVSSIDGCTVLVVGLGDNGRSYARIMKSLGARVIGVRKHGSRTPEYLDELYLVEDLDMLLPRADIVSLCLPETSETVGLIGYQQLKRMRRNAMLLNVGRGSAVDTDALCLVLEDGWLGGVALDVTNPEPLPPNHPLWHFPNAIITPHVSGGYRMSETVERVYQIALRNLASFKAGDPLINILDAKSGYPLSDLE